MGMSAPDTKAMIGVYMEYSCSRHNVVWFVNRLQKGGMWEARDGLRKSVTQDPMSQLELVNFSHGFQAEEIPGQVALKNAFPVDWRNPC